MMEEILDEFPSLEELMIDDRKKELGLPTDNVNNLPNNIPDADADE